MPFNICVNIISKYAIYYVFSCYVPRIRSRSQTGDKENYALVDFIFEYFSLPLLCNARRIVLCYNNRGINKTS